MPNAVAPRRSAGLSGPLLRNLAGAALAVSLGSAPLAYGADPSAAPNAGMTGSPGASSTAGAAASPPAAPAASAASAPDDTFLLTIFLRHDESKPLPKINDQLRAQGFFKTFPPPGIEVVSWYVMMEIGRAHV